MSETHNLKKLQYDGQEIVAEVANRDTSGRIIKDTYVDLATNQEIQGLKRFVTRPQAIDRYNNTSKNIFKKEFSIFDNIGGTDSIYGYFKLPDDTKTYTISARIKDESYVIPVNVYFGWSKDGRNGASWLVQNGQLVNESFISTSTNNRFIIIFPNTQAAFNALINKFNVQIEEGDTMTEYEDPSQSIFPVYENVALMPDISTKTSELINDSGFISNTTANITESQVVNLTNDLTNIREVAEGKSKAIPISLSLNSAFDSQQDTVTASSITDLDGNVIQSNNLKVGDNIYISELNVPDRWYSGNNQFSKLETQKVILPTFTPAFNEGTELLSISDGTKVYVPNAGKFSWTDGMVGVVNKSISQLEPGQYSATTTYQNTIVPKATKMSSGDFWNSSSGAPMDISFYFNTPVAPSMIILGIGTGYPVPDCAIYYYNDNDEETFLQNITLAAGEAVSAKINQSNIYSDKWIVRLTPATWVSIKCVDFAAYQIGIVGPDIVNDIMDKASVTWIQQQQYLQYITCNNTKATKTGSTIKIEDVFKSISGYDVTKKQTLKNVYGTFMWVND